MTAETISLPVASEQIVGDLRVPANAVGLVLFAHGSGSSRFSTRNRAVATVLEERRLGTLLLDLLTREEERIDARSAEYRFDIPRLGERVIQACDWLRSRPDLAALPVGTFGASTGAAAALIAAAARPDRVRAVVSRGGRPDLAGEALRMVKAPTLLIVGERDYDVIALNRAAASQMRAAASATLEIVPGATHLFEEPGTLAMAAALAADWLVTHLQSGNEAI
jgi:putative phosphoribosyl transferase